ncbi:MAG: PilW family protein [bacterium]
MRKFQSSKLKSQIQGMTLVEVVITAAIFLIILIPVITLFTKSTEMMYISDQESTAQKETSAALYNIGQDIQKTLYFGTISSTANNSYFVCTTYNNTGYGTIAVHYYRLASDSTLRRVAPFTGTLQSGGEIIAKNIAAFTCGYRTDTLYNYTLNPTKVAAVYVGVTIAVPGSTVSSFTSNSSWWSRNIRTL